MKRRTLFLLSLFFIAGCSVPMVPGPGFQVETIYETTAAAVLSRDRPALPAREKLVYNVKWIGIPAGKITSEITGIVELNGRRAYRIEVIAETVGLCSVLYRIEDRYVSYMDAERMHVLRQEIHRREGGYKKDSVTDFDQEAHKAYFRSKTDGSEKVFDIPADVQDTITASYVLRTLPLEPGQVYKVPISNSEKNYDVFVAVPDKTTISVPGLGRKEVVRILPYARYQGDDVREGRMTGFVDARSPHTPFYIVIKAPVFTSVTAVLFADPER